MEHTSNNLYFYLTIFCVRKKPTRDLLDILSEEVGRRKNLITRVWSEVAKDEWAGQKNSMKEKYFVRKNHENLMSLSAIKRICRKNTSKTKINVCFFFWIFEFWFLFLQILANCYTLTLIVRMCNVLCTTDVKRGDEAWKDELYLQSFHFNEPIIISV